MLYVHMYACEKIYLHGHEIALCKFVDKFIRYQMIISNLLII